MMTTSVDEMKTEVDETIINIRFIPIIPFSKRVPETITG